MRRLLLAVAAIVLFASGCGAGENEPSLAEAAAKTVAAGSSRFTVAGTITDMDERFEFLCAGEADYDTKSLHVRCDYGTAGDMELVVLAGHTYMRGEVLGFGASDEKWVKLADDESAADQVSPQRLLAMLRRASKTTERVGEEEIQGEDTVRYRLVVDCEQAELFGCEDDAVPVDVWIDGDGLVRRIAIDDASADFAFEFYDFGADVVIGAPPSDDVVGIDEWLRPSPCEMEAGSPITGTDVAAALRRQGLDVEHDDACAADVVATVEVRDAGVGDAGLVHCDVSRTVTETLFTLEGVGMQSAEVGNIRCSYTEQLADSMEKALAELKRAIRP
jgi:hypothetical protein